MNFAAFALPRDLIADFAPSHYRGPVAPACGADADVARATAQPAAAERHLALAVAIVAAAAGVVIALPF